MKKLFKRIQSKMGRFFWRDVLGIVIILTVVALVTEFGIFYDSHPNYYKRISTYFYLFLPSLSLLFFISYNYQKRTTRFVPTAQSIRYRFLMFFLLTALLPSVPVFIISSDVIQRSIDRYFLLEIEDILVLPQKSLELHYRPYYRAAVKNENLPLCSQELLAAWKKNLEYNAVNTDSQKNKNNLSTATIANELAITCYGVDISSQEVSYSNPKAQNFYNFYKNFVNREKKPDIDFFVLPNNDEQAVAVFNLARRLYFFPLKKEEQNIFMKGLEVSKKYQSVIYFVDPLKKVIDFFLAILLIFVLIITILIAFFISKDITDPIIQLSASVREVFSGNIAKAKRRLKRVVQRRSPGELQILAESIQKMVIELEGYKSQQYLIQKNLAWQDVARKMAHEIKNPLTPIQLSIERIERQMKKNEKEIPEDYKKIVKEAGQSILRQINVIKNILNSLSRIYRMPLPNKSDVNLKNILSDLVSENQSEAMLLFLNLEDDDLFIHGDIDQLRRAFLNILQNARQAMNKKKVVVQSATVYIGARWVERDKKIEVFFLDNGPGIESQNINKVTEPNFTTKQEGDGLGLAIASKIFADHNAELFIFSHVEDVQNNKEGETNVVILFEV